VAYIGLVVIGVQWLKVVLPNGPIWLNTPLPEDRNKSEARSSPL